MLIGLGADADILPQLRLSLNINHLRFDTTEVLERLRQQAPIHKALGEDISMSLIWRPFMTQNAVFRLSMAGLIPGKGFEDLFGDDARTPYSILFNMTLTY